MRRVLLLLGILLTLDGPPALAAGALSGGAETGRVKAVLDGDTVLLEDGRRVRLVGIQAPEEGADAGSAAAMLADLALGRPVELRYGGAPTDRYRRRLAHLYREDGLWLQGELLRRGFARVYTFPDNRALAAEMLAAEAEARAARRGLWGDPRFAARSPAEADRLIHSFQLVEGRVVRAADVRGRIFLNFGEDWRRDFTVTIAKAARRRFDGAGFDPLALEGRRVRVRGWLRRWNGPLIEATHPEQIELLSE